MSEKQPTIPTNYEQASDAEQFGSIAHERHDALKHAEKKHTARESEREVVAEAKQLAKEATGNAHSAESATNEKAFRRGPISRKQLDTSFKSQIEMAQSEMKPTQRAASKFIHSKPVEKTSDFVGSTIARPNAMLSGSIFAFIGVTLLYFIAKYYGFELSGFEAIGAFVIGWLVGIIYDYVSVLVKTK